MVNQVLWWKNIPCQHLKSCFQPWSKDSIQSVTVCYESVPTKVEAIVKLQLQQIYNSLGLTNYVLYSSQTWLLFYTLYMAYYKLIRHGKTQNYSQLENEALGLIFGVQKFHRYIYRRNLLKNSNTINILNLVFCFQDL